CLSALASAHPRIRLEAARALEAFADPKAFEAFVIKLLSDRGDDRAPFSIEPQVARTFGEIFAHGDPHLKVRAARVLDALDDDKEDRFDRTSAAFQERFREPLEALLAAAEKRTVAPPVYTFVELREVVFGAYAGLLRMAGGNLEVRVRQTALSRLEEMA